MLLVNVPVPVPSEVLESEVVGFWFVLQQTPLAVIADPPSLEIFPPHVAAEDVIEETEVVVMVPNTAVALNDNSDP